MNAKLTGLPDDDAKARDRASKEFASTTLILSPYERLLLTSSG